MAFQRQSTKQKNIRADEETANQYIHQANPPQDNPSDTAQQCYPSGGAALFRLDAACAALDMTDSALLKLYGAAQKRGTDGGRCINNAPPHMDVREQTGKIAGMRHAFTAYAEQVKREERARLTEVKKKLAAIGRVTLRSEDKIKAAEDALVKLPEHLKDYESIADRIKSARLQLVNLIKAQAYQRQLNAVRATVDAIGAANTEAKIRAAIQTAEAAYNALPFNLKPNEMLGRIEAAKAQLKQFLQYGTDFKKNWKAVQGVRSARTRKTKVKRLLLFLTAVVVIVAIIGNCA